MDSPQTRTNSRRIVSDCVFFRTMVGVAPMLQGLSEDAADEKSILVLASFSFFFLSWFLVGCALDERKEEEQE